ncbi:MAG TPA: hypothetical protein PK400_03675 [Phycisphaerales bacterium]|nr:hypothetical protein [Phycisphaerales bacterium]HRQ75497.1 hypothetical protein [Phycisphaerales bacterium]
MTTTRNTPAAHYHWKPESDAQAFINELLTEFMDRCPPASHLAQRMRHDTGTRFVDWVDFIEVRDDAGVRRRLAEVGFEPRPRSAHAEVFEHDGGIFPQVVLAETRSMRVGIKVDFVSDFLAALSITNDYVIQGGPMTPLRRAPAFVEPTASLWVVERHGTRSFDPLPPDPNRCMAAIHHYECFRRRRRDWPEDVQGWARVNELIDKAVRDLGVDHACAIFFTAEREYWQRRNRAARIQKSRQDTLGLGWANHDHHTYRSSRAAFSSLIATFERLGFICRERFYAGAEAGWGAQVLEQPEARLVIFADVDLSEDEIAGDFAHEPLRARDAVGTVGLWVGLHGESFLQAGMHHLECQFEFEALRDQLQAAGVGSMPPFTDLPYLRQAFTEGERWQVSEQRVQRLLDAGVITPMQATQFRMQGAIGSHLENLERHDGYKGFNQKGVSDIISRTDPRRHSATEPLVGA